jgi:RNA polymerase sigma-54 factor
MQNIVPMSRNFLELRLGQSLTLTPALQQSIKLLQLSALELEAEIARALAENPLLEQEGEGLQTPAAAAIAHPGDGPLYEGDAKEQAQAEADFASDERYDDSRSSDARPYRVFVRAPRHRGMMTFPERPEPARESNLREHLLSQLGTTRLGAKDAALVELLIEELNEDGFLASPLDEIASWMKPELGLEAEDFNAPLRMLQSFDPPGVGARDLAECLTLQVQFAEPDRFPELSDGADTRAYLRPCVSGILRCLRQAT